MVDGLAGARSTRLIGGDVARAGDPEPAAGLAVSAALDRDRGTGPASDEAAGPPAARPGAVQADVVEDGGGQRGAARPPHSEQPLGRPHGERRAGAQQPPPPPTTQPPPARA